MLVAVSHTSLEVLRITEVTGGTCWYLGCGRTIRASGAECALCQVLQMLGRMTAEHYLFIWSSSLAILLSACCIKGVVFRVLRSRGRRSLPSRAYGQGVRDKRRWVFASVGSDRHDQITSEASFNFKNLWLFCKLPFIGLLPQGRNCGCAFYCMGHVACNKGDVFFKIRDMKEEESVGVLL